MRHSRFWKKLRENKGILAVPPAGQGEHWFAARGGKRL